MIAGWLLYCVAVSALLASAARIAEAILTRRGRAARGVWVAAIVGSLLIPAAALILQSRTPTPLPRAGAVFNGVLARGEAIDARRATPESRRAIATPPRPRAPELASADRAVVAFVTVCIVLAAVRLLFDSLILYRRRRRWIRGTVDDMAVLLSDDIGPAIVGIVEPMIVLPRWTESLTQHERALIIAHEREHIQAQDGRLSTAALLAMMIVPWNPVAWWTLARLRSAIEVDCDRRVLSRFPDTSRYARLLVDVAQRVVSSSFAIAAFSERAKPLARRIRAMTPVRPLRRIDMATAMTGAFALIGAVTVLPPAGPARQLPQYRRPFTLLPKNVGDSIAEGETPPTLVAAARGLPAEFSAVSYATPEQEMPTAARCAEWLRDDRDSTRLHLSMSRTGTSGVEQRLDTAWTRIESIGFYYIVPAGRYGVSKDQTLRVGCGGFTRISVGDHDLALVPGVTLDSRDDDRARRIADRLTADLRVHADEITLRRGRINLLFADSTNSVRGDQRAFGPKAFGVLRDVLGVAVPETLAVTARISKAQWITNYYYWSMTK